MARHDLLSMLGFLAILAIAAGIARNMRWYHRVAQQKGACDACIYVRYILHRFHAPDITDLQAIEWIQWLGGLRDSRWKPVPVSGLAIHGWYFETRLSDGPWGSGYNKALETLQRFVSHIAPGGQEFVSSDSILEIVTLIETDLAKSYRDWVRRGPAIIAVNNAAINHSHGTFDLDPWILSVYERNSTAWEDSDEDDDTCTSYLEALETEQARVHAAEHQGCLFRTDTPSTQPVA